MTKFSPFGGWSIFARHAASYLLVVAFVFTLFGAYFYITARRHLEREVGRKLEDIALIVARNAPYDRLTLIKTGDDRSRMVLRLKEKLEEIRAATGVENITIGRPEAIVLLDLTGGRLIGEPASWPLLTEPLRRSLKQGETVSTGSYRTSGGGLYMTAYAPISESDGGLYALVAVDAGTAEIEVLENLRGRLLGTIVAGAALAMVLSVVLARNLARPIRSMAAAAERIGGGDYGARVAEPSTRELRILASSINEMAEQVRRRNATLKEMSARVAHEIRNPLNSIALLVKLLEEETEEAGLGGSGTTNTLKEEIAKLNRFLSEYLTFSRPVVLAKTLCNPADPAARAIEMASAESKAKGVNVRLSVLEALPAISADRARLEQALLNLLLNAVQATPEGGEVNVAIDHDEEQGSVRFTVTDTGPGVASDAMDRLFEPFFTTRLTGTGLGLANAKTIVEDHGGRLTVENTPSGARFIVLIPLLPADTQRG